MLGVVSSKPGNPDPRTQDETIAEHAQQKRPSQIKFVRPAQMGLFANVTCWPPLGQVTFLKRAKNQTGSGSTDKLRFTVVLQSARSLPEQPWDVSIWHNVKGDWEALPLEKRDPPFVPMECGNALSENCHSYTFSQDLDFPLTGKHSAFTVRYRIDEYSPWQWVNEQFGARDGDLVFEPVPTQLASSRSLGEFINDLNQSLQIESRMSESPGTLLWNVKGEVGPAQGAQSVAQSLEFGSPKDFMRNFSLVRIWSPWLAPRHGTDKFRLTEDGLLISFLLKGGEHLVLLAVSGVDNVTTVFQSGTNSEIIISAKNDNRRESKFQILAAVGSSFELANSAVIYEARKVMRPFSEPLVSTEVVVDALPGSPLGDDIVLVENEPKAQWMSSWYDGLAYCTWNALGQDLNEEKILNALDTLRTNGINIVNLIIDDNWQSLDNKGQSQFKRGWLEFEANRDGFPNGLKHTVNNIRRKHPNIQHIAVWHALMGYWGGISPDGEIAKTYKTKAVKKVEGVAGGTMLAVDPDDIRRFYNDLYSFLSSIGVDSVKTDAQFFLDLLEDPEDRARFTTAYQDAWTIATLRHFGEKAISCMSQTPQIIFHSQAPTNKPRILLRNSDDFFPDIPTSHPWHVFCNAHNSLLTRHLNVIPDWDMFQTSHPYASFHAAARCVSGGPIYITDVPGQHDLDVVKQMTATATDGGTIILRPSVLGRTMDEYHNYNEGHMLKVGTYTGWAKTGSGILGLFNVSSRKVSSLISILDFPGILPGSKDEYVIRAHSSGAITRIMLPAAQDSLLSVSLETRGWEILTVYPIRSFTLRDHNGNENADKESISNVAVLGLLGKMTGAAAIVSSDLRLMDNGRLKFDVNLKALGTLGLYISDLETKTVENNFMVMLSGVAVPQHTVRKSNTGCGPGGKANVLEIDIEAAWTEMGLSSGWLNEVVVHIFMS
ncbi:hypothetical protein AJ80_06079 [Polytolypa hystricis UAMH7299]|uniref:Uncharacterized protein n=1 Tax=Polytolypa hystricis (strain UAMH7299) TaxID=1447883 RepID=A0A2B7XYQ4_POLH7|nr:hypothetical protein AJ80_06079 [Polytolypa hystricis UAMH7299]